MLCGKEQRSRSGKVVAACAGVGRCCWWPGEEMIQPIHGEGKQLGCAAVKKGMRELLLGLIIRVRVNVVV